MLNNKEKCGKITKSTQKGWEFMKKTLRIVVFCLVALFALTACSTVNNTTELKINGNLITFDCAGGQLVDGELSRAISERKQDVITLPLAEKEGYNFAGWLEATPVATTEAVAVSESAEATAAPLFEVVKKEVKTPKLYVAQWTLQEYKVRFESRLVFGTIGGDVKDLPAYKSKIYTIETPIDIPALTNITGYEFVGWIEDGAGEGSAVRVVKKNKGTVTGDKTVVALWRPCTYTVSVDGEVKAQYVYKCDGFIKIANPTKTGYDFEGWACEEGAIAEVKDNSVVINTAYAGNIALTSQWNTIEYPITYNEDGLIIDDLYVPTEDPVEEAEEPEEVVPPTNPDFYDITEEVSFIKPTREGFTFLGWVEKSQYDMEKIDLAKLTADMVLPVTDPNYCIKVGTTGEKDLVAIWGRRVYLVTYDLQSGSLKESNPTQFLFDQKAFELNAPTRDFYIFKGWKDLKSGKIYTSEFTDTAVDRNVTLVAQWAPVEYSISYDLDGGEFEGEAPTSYNYETKTFTLPTPVKRGYTFTGWAVTEEVAYDPVLFTLTFNVEGVDFTVKVFGTKTEWVFPVGLSDNLIQVLEQYLAKEFPEAETKRNGNIITLDVTNGDPSILEGLIKGIASDAGFALEYQKTVLADVKYDDITIYQGSNGNRAYKATWEINVYSIDYASDEEYGPRIEPEPEVYEYPTRYTAEEIVEIKDPEKYGYDFMGWVLDDQEYTEAQTGLVLEKGSIGDRLYVPLFQLHNYNVILQLDGGTVEAPASFTINDSDFVIGKAVRDNYLFKGWLCDDGSTKYEVEVDCAKAQDVVLEAVWEPIEYTITYELNDGDFEIGIADNATNYTVETEPFTLVNPIKETYEFAGWMIKGMEKKMYPVVDYCFDTSKGGNLTLVATWKAKEYKISYNLDGGAFEYVDSNPAFFTNFEEDIELEAPKRAGYTFLGWVEAGKEGYKPVANYVIKASELRRDVALKAVWKASAYSINYDLDGGYFSRGAVINPTSYTTEDRAFILMNPVKDGYEFLGWVRSAYSSTDYPALVLRVDTSKGGNLSYKALWKANSYTISYNLDGGSYQYGNSNPTTYTADSYFTLANPHKAGYTFLGWVRSGDPLELVKDTVTIGCGTTGNLTFYAIYEQTLVAVGEVTKLQTQIIELGKNDIPRPDWVIKAPEESKYHYEKAYASGSDFITNLENASIKCREYLAAYVETEVSTVSKNVNGMTYNTQTTEVNTKLTGSEMVEYWEDANGGVWVLMRISK